MGGSVSGTVLAIAGHAEGVMNWSARYEVRKIAQRGDEFTGEAASTVSRVVNNHEAASGPPSVQRPGSVQGSGDVVATMDRNGRNVDEPIHAGCREE